MANIRVLGDVELTGALSFNSNYSDFPANPSPRTIIVKEGIPYIYTELQNGSGFFTWQPMGVGMQQTSYLHVQGLASTVWTVSHNFNTQNFAYFVYDENHNLMLANIEMIDDNTCKIKLASAMTGTAVLFSLQYLNSVNLEVTNQIDLGGSILSSNNGVLNVSGNPVAFKAYVDSQDSALSTRIDNIAANIDPAAIDSISELLTAFQASDGNLSSAISGLSTSTSTAVSNETLRATLAEGALQTSIDNLSSGLTSSASDLATEVADRIAGDATIQASVDTEVANRISAIALVQADVDTKAVAANTYTKTEVDTSLSTKVDKVSGKGLSTEDYTSAEKSKLSNIESGAQVNTVTSVASKTGAVTLVKGDVGLGNVDNTSDANKPVSTATQTALDSKANLLGSTSHDFSVKGLTVSGDIMPAVSGVSNIGSATQKFNAIYTKEMHIDANTLYVDGVPVLGSSANTIQITADVNQGIRVATTGTGHTIIDSQTATTIQTSGMNADVLIQATGSGSQARISGTSKVVLTAPITEVSGDQTVSGALTVSGNFTVNGTTTFVDSTNMFVKDNIITLNKGENGSGVSLGLAGFDIDRGDLARERLIWKESTGKWAMGETNSEVNIASENYVTSAIASKANSATTLSGYGITNAYTKTEVDSAVSVKANSADVYTKAEVDAAIAAAISAFAATLYV